MFKPEDLRALAAAYPGASVCTEGSKPYILIPKMKLPAGCKPECVDALLCPHGRDGYPSRLFFSGIVTGPTAPNWNAQSIRILERNWFGYSWKNVPATLTPVQMILSHLRGLRSA